MRQLALSRGFYPMVAVDLNDNNFGGRGSGKSYGKSRNTGGGKGKGKSREKVARVKARAVEKELDTFCPEPEDLSSAEDLHRRTTHRHPRWQGRLQVEALPSMDHGSKDIDFQHLASRKSLTTPTSPQRPHRFLEVSIGMKWSHKNCLW